MAMVVGSRRMRRLQAGLVYAALIALAGIFLFPLLWVLGLSLKTRLQVFANPPLFIWWPTLENYADVLGRSDFLLAFVNTLVNRWFADSLLERDGFELLVPPSRRTAVRRARPFVFLAPGCTGCDRFNSRERRLRTPGIPK